MHTEIDRSVDPAIFQISQQASSISDCSRDVKVWTPCVVQFNACTLLNVDRHFCGLANKHHWKQSRKGKKGREIESHWNRQTPFHKLNVKIIFVMGWRPVLMNTTDYSTSHPSRDPADGARKRWHETRHFCGRINEYQIRSIKTKKEID